MLNKEKIELFTSKTQAIFSTNGGCLQKFVVNGQDILYPETSLRINGEQKKRGGMPVLFPWAGALKNYPQHGFARNLKWKKMPVHHDLVKKRALLELSDNKETFEIFPYHFRCQLKLEIKEKELFYLLTVNNEDHKNMPIAPGFHPYFKIPDGSFELLETNIDGFKAKNYKLTETLFFQIQPVEIKIPGSDKIKINFGQDFIRKKAKIAIWTDNKKYLCVEPWSASLGGFLRKDEGILVPPGRSKKFAISFKITSGFN